MYRFAANLSISQRTISIFSPFLSDDYRRHRGTFLRPKLIHNHALGAIKGRSSGFWPQFCSKIPMFVLSLPEGKLRFVAQRSGDIAPSKSCLLKQLSMTAEFSYVTGRTRYGYPGPFKPIQAFFLLCTR